MLLAAMIIHDQPPHLSCEIILKRLLEVGLFIGKGGETIKDLTEPWWILTSFKHVFFFFFL